MGRRGNASHSWGDKWGLCMLLTETLWTGVFEHFFNDFISNSLQRVTDTEIDELQIFRMVGSNILSLSLVMLVSYWSRGRRNG